MVSIVLLLALLILFMVLLLLDMIVQWVENVALVAFLLRILPIYILFEALLLCLDAQR